MDEVKELIHRNRMLEEEVKRLRIYQEYAYTDVLTEIPNRRFFYERVSQEVARATRNNHALTVALVDLDRFKEINDRAGHRVGDEILKFFAQFLRANIRQEDVVCRLGGDEFVLLLPDTSTESASTLLERIRQKLEKVELAVDGRARCQLSFSCGVASHQDGLLVEDLVEAADHSLFTAKVRGRNRVVSAPKARAVGQELVH